MSKPIITVNGLSKRYRIGVRRVKRNIERFPEDFMFQLTWDEAEYSRSQFVTLNDRRREGRSEKD